MKKITLQAIIITVAIVAPLLLLNQCSYKNSIHNPENSAFVVETASNLDIEPGEVTQKQFNERYNNK